MNRNKKRAMALAVAVLLGVGASAGVAWARHTPTIGTARLLDTNGKSAGTVTFEQIGDKMSVSATVLLPKQFAGFHGFHLHRVGQCDPNAVDPTTGLKSAFYSASGHIGSEDGHNHADHDGDLPSLLVNRDGSSRVTVRTDRVSFDRLFDADGTAVMIHLERDNFANIPARYAANGPDAATLATGDSGARTVCGIVVRG